jgi:hypothetical protein
MILENPLLGTGGSGSSGRVPAWQAHYPAFKLQCHKKREREKKKEEEEGRKGKEREKEKETE